MLNKKRKNARKMERDVRQKEPSYWKIVAIIALVFSMGFAIKMISSPSRDISPGGQDYQRLLSADKVLEKKVQRVASEFKCACGGCGELPLIICDCSMPRGAVEEKTFILRKLEEGLTVEEVIRSVNEKYDHKIT